MVRLVYFAALAVLAACSVETSATGEGDGGVSGGDGGGMCTPVAEECNGLDDDCDGATDEAFDLTSTMNCGTCGNACPANPDNGAYACVAGACTLECDPRFADCDGNSENGCEQSLSSAMHCGSCGNACPPAMPMCSTSGGTATCVSSCPSGETPCAGTCANLSTDVTNCGSCGNACAARENATTACVSGSCSATCLEGFADCDTDLPANGCEASLDAVTSCGACGNDCRRSGGTAACVSRVCELTCDPLLGDCDGDDMNGCEQTLTTDTNCGGCGVACSPTNATSSCSTGTCVITMCDAGYGDCDMRPMNGCEADFSSLATCGGCGWDCRGTETCDSGGCLPCPAGYDSCSTGCARASPCSCPSGDDCAFGCNAAECEMNCTSGDSTDCDLVARNRSRVDVTCDNPDCVVDARGSSNVTMTCTDWDSTCILDCREGGDCELSCTDNAHCEILCDAGSTTCGFSACTGGGPVTCGTAPSGATRMVCNRFC